jgi:hypothetical protein
VLFPKLTVFRVLDENDENDVSDVEGEEEGRKLLLHIVKLDLWFTRRFGRNYERSSRSIKI